MPEFVSPPEATDAAISAYRDALLRNVPRPELAQLAASLDPEIVAWLELMRGGQRAMAPDPGFVTRLAGQLETAPGPAITPQPAPPEARRVRRSHAVAMSRQGEPVAIPTRRPKALRRVLPQLVTVALLLVLAVGGLYLAGPLRPELTEQQLVALDAPIQLIPLWKTVSDEPMGSPYGVGIYPQGTIWVADEHRFHLVAPDGTISETWGTEGAGEGQFDFLSRSTSIIRDYGDVAFDAEGNIYVTDSGNMRVQKFAPDRTFVLAWGEKGKGDGQFLSPTSIAIGPNGVIYVGDDGRSDIQMFDTNGTYVGTIGKFGLGEGQFLMPSGVAVSGTGDIYVADYGNKRIQRFTADGDFLGMWGKPGKGEGQFDSPNDVAIDAQGRVFVVEDINSRVQVFTPDGHFLTMAGTFGSELGQLDDPLGIALGADGVVYVSDRNGLQAFRVEPSGASWDLD